MEVEKSRNGYYTITFLNKNNANEREIHKDFSSVGNVCKIIQNSQRVFIRFKEKEEAERAIKKFGKLYDVTVAKNKFSDNHQQEGGHNHNHKPSNNLPVNSTPLLSSPEIQNSTQSMEKLNTNGGTVFHLILGNLPKNYTINDIRALVEEAKPIYINQIEETRVFNIRFCHIVLSTVENLNYLIEKLNGFMISGEKLIAAEAKHLIEWRQNAV